MQYLDLMTPHNCYIIHRDQAYKQLPDLQIEEIYGTQFKVKEIEEATLNSW